MMIAPRVLPVAQETGMGIKTVNRPTVRKPWWTVLALLFALLVLGAGHGAAAQEQPFSKWLRDLRRDALAYGIKSSVLDAALKDVTPIERVLELDRRQPEFTLTFWKYLNGRVTEGRVKLGRELLEKHAALFEKVWRRYGVQPRFLVAFWGLESNFGKHTGSFPLIGALATLAHDERRSEFFRGELIAALSVMSRGDIPFDAKASWAGAMGNVQFMPSSYRDFAVDFDGDHRRDLWNSLPDVFASAANYLSRSGWRGDKTWGREVKLPSGFNLELADMKIRKSLAEWQRLGVRRITGGNLPNVNIDASLILPAGFNGPAFLVYQNFRTILVWNRSLLYAIAVGHLADRLTGGKPFLTPRPENEVALSRFDVMDLQRRLNAKGFDAGTPDGVIGPKTRDAIKSFQIREKLPQDGYPNAGLLERLRGTGGS